MRISGIGVRTYTYNRPSGPSYQADAPVEVQVDDGRPSTNRRTPATSSPSRGVSQAPSAGSSGMQREPSPGQSQNRGQSSKGDDLTSLAEALGPKIASLGLNLECGRSGRIIGRWGPNARPHLVERVNRGVDRAFGRVVELLDNAFRRIGL